MEQSLIPKDIREKTKYCFECGICTASCPMTELFAKYNPRSLLQKALSNPEKAVNEDRLWLCAWCYRCLKRCPHGLKPPEIFQLLKDEAARSGSLGGFEKAIPVMEEAVPLPIICWYTCFHPERAKITEEKMTEALRTLTALHRKAKREKVGRRDERVAVIGSGPAGLTAAWELTQDGYHVTIFEALPFAGGMLRRCMPRFRLPADALDAEIQLLRNFEVEIRTNVRVGEDITFDKLWQDGYKAVFVAVGAHKSRELSIKGSDLEGVVDALDFLWAVNTQQKSLVGKIVGVIGGGNVAVDAARTAIRQGAKRISILYRRSREEMPANPWELKEAESEGVKIRFLVAPKKILGRGRKAVGLECVRTKLGEPDETGRRSPTPIEGSEFSLKFDTIIVAIGEEPDTSFLPLDVDVDKASRVLVDPFTMETSMKGIFAGGDTVTGPATVIEAVVAGKAAARSISQYLSQAEGKEKKEHGD